MENDSRLSTALLNENREQTEQTRRQSEHHETNSSARLPDNGSTTNPDQPSSAATGQGTATTATKIKSSYKIIVLGDSGVGKTCLSFRFCAGRFPLTSEATIGLDFREKIIELDGQRLKLQLWDTAGQERFRKSITHHYYRNVDAVVFVYDVNSVSSFQGLDAWLEEVNLHGIPEAVPRILVGNKCDMGMAAVNTRQAQRWADDRNMPLFETSAKDDTRADHVDGIFLTLAHKIHHKKPLIRPVADPSDPGTTPVRLVYQSHLAGRDDQPEPGCCF